MFVVETISIAPLFGLVQNAIKITCLRVHIHLDSALQTLLLLLLVLEYFFVMCISLLRMTSKLHVCVYIFIYIAPYRPSSYYSSWNISL